MITASVMKELTVNRGTFYRCNVAVTGSYPSQIHYDLMLKKRLQGTQER